VIGALRLRLFAVNNLMKFPVRVIWPHGSDPHEPGTILKASEVFPVAILIADAEGRIVLEYGKPKRCLVINETD
jgi:hypothetical protein